MTFRIGRPIDMEIKSRGSEAKGGDTTEAGCECPVRLGQFDRVGARESLSALSQVAEVMLLFGRAPADHPA